MQIISQSGFLYCPRIPTLLPNRVSPNPLPFFNGENNRLCLTYCAVDSAKQNTALKWCGRFTGMFHDERAYKTKQEGTCYIKPHKGGEIRPTHPPLPLRPDCKTLVHYSACPSIMSQI